MADTLTEGSIQTMIDEEVVDYYNLTPMLLVVAVQYELNTYPRKYLLELSDGQKSLLGSIEHGLEIHRPVKEGLLRRGSIVKLTRFSVKDFQGVRTIYVTDMDIVTHIDTQKLAALTSVPSPLPTDYEMESDDGESFVASTQEREYQELKDTIVEKFKDFRSLLLTVQNFIRNTRTVTNQVRAMIRCLNILIVDFNECWKQYGNVTEELGGVARPFSFALEKSSLDELRSEADSLLMFLTRTTLKDFAKKFSPSLTPPSASTKDAVLAMEGVFETSISLVNRVMDNGYDCRRD